MGLGGGGTPAVSANNPFNSALTSTPQPAASTPASSGSGSILRGSALGKVDSPPPVGWIPSMTWLHPSEGPNFKGFTLPRYTSLGEISTVTPPPCSVLF